MNHFRTEGKKRLSDLTMNARRLRVCIQVCYVGVVAIREKGFSLSHFQNDHCKPLVA